jgi:hypothetical protein
MRQAIVLAATTLILTAGQAMAEGSASPRHVNGSSPGMRPICICTCLDKPCDECYECFEVSAADGRWHAVRTTNRYSTAIPGAKPYLSALPRSARCGGV